MYISITHINTVSIFHVTLKFNTVHVFYSERSVKTQITVWVHLTSVSWGVFLSPCMDDLKMNE